MLEDCAGDRVEELLAVFSTIVLRKVVLAKATDPEGIVERLATEDHIHPEEQKLMLPLVCAHRASLAALLRKRKLLRSRYSAFSQSLESDSKSIVKALEILNTDAEARTYKNEVGPTEAEALISQVRESWLGEGRWTRLVIGGRLQWSPSTMVESTFADAFAQVKDGNDGSVRDCKSKDLLEDLESRVSEQQERLTRWGRFREDLRKLAGHSESEQHDAARHAGRSTHQKIHVAFQDHQHLLPGAMSPAKKDPYKSGEASMIDITHLATSKAYDRLVERMQEDLRNVSRPGAQRGKSWRKTREDSPSLAEYQDPFAINDPKSIRDYREQKFVSEAEDINTVMTSGNRFVANKQGQRPITDPVETLSSLDGLKDVEHEKVQTRVPRHRFDDSSPSRPRARDSMSGLDAAFTSKTSLPDIPEMHTHTEGASISEDQDPELLAETIISSVTEAAYTPAKPKPSLIERTRMSMALSSSHSIPQTPMGPPLLPARDPEEAPKPLRGLLDNHRRSTLLERTRQSMSMPYPVLSAPDLEETPKPRKGPMDIDRGSTLVERTRQSMSMLPATSYRTRKPNYNLRFSKGHPVNQFETPRKQQGQRSNEEAPSTPPEELFSELDYATVFKSRPKIALSPTVSISLNKDPSLLDGVTDHASDDISWGSSPLTRVR